MASPNLNSLLTTLATSGVEFILVGALAAVAQGATVTTHDVDIVPRRERSNIERLVEVLVRDLDAQYRGRSDGLRPTVEVLMGPGHSLLKTNAGPLDVLGAIEEGRDYEALHPRTNEIPFAGRTLLVLDLSMLIELKRSSTRLKDQLAMPVLEAALRRRGG